MRLRELKARRNAESFILRRVNEKFVVRRFVRHFELRESVRHVAVYLNNSELPIDSNVNRDQLVGLKRLPLESPHQPNSYH
jgi:hypothetical protein